MWATSHDLMEHLLPALQSSILFSSPPACTTTGGNVGTLVVLVVFGRAPWGTPYHFLLISLISPTAPRVYPLTFPLNPIRSLTASLSYSMSFPSDSHQIFHNFQRVPPAIPL